ERRRLIDGGADRTVFLFQISRAVDSGGFSATSAPFHGYLTSSRVIASVRLGQAKARSAPFIMPHLLRTLVMDLGLKNRVALVAASSQGLGLATAEGFAVEGCRVAMCARNQQTLEAAADNIR